MRRIAVILSLAVLAGSCRGRGQKAEQYKTEKVDRGDITQTVTATGTLSAVTTVQVGSQVSGVISRLYADFNSRVKKGQLLAELDPTPFQQQVEQRQADLTKANVEAANAKISLTRQDRLVKAGIGVTADYDAAKATYEGDVAQVAQARAALAQAQTNLKYTKIISPIDGIVVDGTVSGSDPVVVEGTIKGRINVTNDLRIGTKARIEATVHAKNVTVEGKLTGDVSADERVELVASATVDGNIKAPKIVVAEGARFRGAVDMGSSRPREAPQETKAK